MTIWESVKKKTGNKKKSAYDQVTDDEMRGGDEGVGSTKYNDCLNWERRM